jgi:hypothetical protein
MTRISILPAVLLAAALAAAAPPAHAQKMIGDIAYSVSVPTGEARDFSEGPGWMGVVMDWRSEVDTRLTLGLSAGWNRIRSDVTGSADPALDGERTLDVVPLLINIHTYTTTRRGAISVYFGLGAGAYYVHQGITGTSGELKESSWHFGGAPEIGVFAPLGSLGIFGNVKYHYVFPAGTSLMGADNRYSYFAIGIGLAWSTY